MNQIVGFENLRKCLDKDTYILLFFTASWCGPCKKAKPIIDENVNGFLNIDINNEPWNVVFNSILESKNLAYSGDTEKGLIKVFPDIPSGEVVLKNEIFNIYYETPSKIKTQIESLFAGTGEGEGSLILNVDDENKTIIALHSGGLSGIPGYENRYKIKLFS